MLLLCTVEKRELARLKLEFKEYSVKKKGKAMDRYIADVLWLTKTCMENSCAH